MLQGNQHKASIYVEALRVVDNEGCVSRRGPLPTWGVTFRNENDELRAVLVVAEDEHHAKEEGLALLALLGIARSDVEGELQTRKLGYEGTAECAAAFDAFALDVVRGGGNLINTNDFR